MHLVRVFRPIGEGAVPGGAGETELAPPTLARRGEGSRRLRQAQEGGGERGWTPAVQGHAAQGTA